jgi:hypothetical protein
MQGKKMMRNLAPSHKRGDKKNEMAVKHRKATKNFSQSKDVREDRGRRQTKLGRIKQSKQSMFGRR